MTDQDDLLRQLADQDALVVLKRDSTDISDQRDVAYSLLTRARLLGELGRVDEAIVQFADMRRAFSESDDEFLRACMAASWVSEGYLHGVHAHEEEALASYDGAITLVDGSSSPLLQEQAISAYYRKALALRSSGRYGEAVEVIAELLNTFAPAPPRGDRPEILAPTRSMPEIAQAFLLFAGLAGDLGQASRAIPMYDKMIELLGDEDDADVQETVGRARLSKAALLGRGGQLTEAIDLCRTVLSCIDGSSDPRVTALRAMALADCGHWLQTAGRPQEAADCFRDLVANFRPGQDDEVDDALIRARHGLEA